jgi:proline iminopeptidase
VNVAYLDSSGRDDRRSGGSRRIPIDTPVGRFEVWTKRVGNNPSLRVLLLHGGPGSTHEYFEAADSWLPAALVEYYYYDQLGSGWSDVPTDESLWDLPRFVDEVEQVRVALALDSDSFVLLGHSWGGILATEYALAHGEHLKGLVISNMMMDVPAYNAYARDVLMPAMDQQALAEIQALEEARDYQNPRFMELLMQHHYVHHVLRMPTAEWPDPARRGFEHINEAIYVKMQGPSELGISAAATLAEWSRFEDLRRIDVPTLVIGAAHDTMDPTHMQEVARRLPRGTYLHCPQGSHMAMYDDQDTYFQGLISWLHQLG